MNINGFIGVTNDSKSLYIVFIDKMVNEKHTLFPLSIGLNGEETFKFFHDELLLKSEVYKNGFGYPFFDKTTTESLSHYVNSVIIKANTISEYSKRGISFYHGRKKIKTFSGFLENIYDESPVVIRYSYDKSILIPYRPFYIIELANGGYYKKPGGYTKDVYSATRFQIETDALDEMFSLSNVCSSEEPALKYAVKVMNYTTYKTKDMD